MRALALVTIALAAACGPADDGEVEVAVDRSAVAVDGTVRSASSMGPFQPGDVLAQLAPEEARRRALSDVVATYRAVVRPRDCLAVDTDESTYVDLTFEGCRVGFFGLIRIDGSIRGELELQTEPCPDGECVKAVVYDVVVTQLEIGWGEEPGLIIDGAWTFRAPVQDASPLSLSGDVTYTGPRGRSLHVISDSTWSRDGPCVELSSDVQIEAQDEAGEVLGGLVAAVTDLSACTGECPSAGTVRLAFARGDVVWWSYTGESVITVHKPGGESSDVQLQCAPS